jgi:hypothetical protein
MASNSLQLPESQISCLYLKNTKNSKTTKIEGLPTGFEGQDHQEKRHANLMCDSKNKSMKVHTRSSLPPDHPSCWGKWPSEALSTSGQADGFSSRAASAARGSFCSDGLTETLILPELCRFFCAGVAHLSGAGLRCRRHGQLCFAPKVWRKPGAPRIENTSDRGWRRLGRDVLKGMTRPGRDLGPFRCRRCGALRHVAAANV